MRLADELLELSDDRMIGKAHPGIGQIGDGLAVKRTAFAEDIERHAGQAKAGAPSRGSSVAASMHPDARG